MSVNTRSFFFIASSIVSLIYLLINDVLTWHVYLLPMVFGLIYPIYEKKLKSTSHISFSIIAVLLMYWIRLVLLPCLSYCTINEYSKDFSIPIFLTLYEFIIISIFIVNVKFSIYDNKKISLNGNSTVYVVYGLIALVVYFLYARGLGLFDFIVKDVGTTERGGDVTSTKLILTKQIINSGMLFIYLLFAYKYAQKYHTTNKKSYFYFILIVSLLFLSIISGERRTSIIYKAFAILVVLIHLYPQQRQKLTRYIIAISAIILIFMTIYKSFHAYLYSSYLDALNSRNIFDAIGGNTLDAYFYGIQTIKKNIEFIQKEGLSLLNLFYDFFRSIFGLHFLFKDIGFTTSQLYNLSIYGGEQSSGYLFASISYGYAYFGGILAPIVPLGAVFAMTKVENMMWKTSSIEMQYIYALIFMRLAFGFIGDPTSLLNMTTQIFIIYGVFYFFAKLLK